MHDQMKNRIRERLIESLLNEDLNMDNIPPSEYPPNGGGKWFLDGNDFYWVVNENGNLNIGPAIPANSPESPLNMPNYSHSTGSGYVVRPTVWFFNLNTGKMQKRTSSGQNRFIRSINGRNIANAMIDTSNDLNSLFGLIPNIPRYPFLGVGGLGDVGETPIFAVDQ